MKDSKNRFYEHVYHNNTFISCKCSTYAELLDAFSFIYNNVYNVKATATETTATAQKAKWHKCHKRKATRKSRFFVSMNVSYKAHAHFSVFFAS